MTKSATNLLTRQILQFLFEQKCFAWRNNSGGIFDQKLGRYRSSPKVGTPDILGIYNGLFVGIEVKTGKDKLRPEQIGFIKSAEYVGGQCFIAHNLDDFVKEWRDWIISTELPVA